MGRKVLIKKRVGCLLAKKDGITEDEGTPQSPHIGWARAGLAGTPGMSTGIPGGKTYIE